MTNGMLRTLVRFTYNNLVPPDKVTEEDYEIFQYLEKEKEERERKARQREREQIEKFKQKRQEIVWKTLEEEAPVIEEDNYEVPTIIPVVKTGPKLANTKRQRTEDSESDNEVPRKLPNKSSTKSAIDKICCYESSDDD